MKICAITMVYRDYWALSQWYAHYGRHVGEGNLFVVSHGSDPRVQMICPKASVITVPRDDLSGFDQVRGTMLNSLQKMLGLTYDWVIRTDADELICLDPDVFSSFGDMLSQQTASAVFALGMDLFEFEADIPLKDQDNVLSKRSNVVFSGHYSKAWAVRDGTALMRHGVKVKASNVEGFVFRIPEGVFLVHLKHANMAASELSNVHRMQMASGKGKGLPGKNWLIADDRAVMQVIKAQIKPVRRWSHAVTSAYEAVKTPVIQKPKGLIRARSVTADIRTILPDWFKTY